jgi:hypothetical protein
MSPVRAILEPMTAGDLIRRRGNWITEAPTHCPNGHQLGPQRVLVGHTACTGHGGGGHTIWHCVECDAITYGPPLADHCSITVGPAYLRGFGVEDTTTELPPTPF